MSWFIIALGIILIGGGKRLGSSIGKKTENLFFDPSNLEDNSSPNITINNYTTEQHLHISEQTAQNLSNNE